MSTGTPAGAIARALNQIKPVYCPPPAYRPPETVRGTMSCTLCPDGTVHYTVRASDGACDGRCTTAGCLNWRE